jgi:hypothetical protein
VSELASERSAPRSLLRRLLRRDEVPGDVAAGLDPDEHVLASAALTGGGHLVATSRGLWLPDGPRRLGWHLISKATWGNGAIALVEAEEVEDLGGAVVITDRPVVRLRLAEPGRVPQVVHERVTASIRSRHHRELPASADARSAGATRGGAWFVQRKVAGRDGVVLQVRPDPGTDGAAVRQVAGDSARKLGFA